MKEVTIEDHALRMAFEEIGIKPPYSFEALHDITELEWTEYMEEDNVLWIPIHRLDGIEYCYNLICLYLTGNKIRELAPLGALANLEELYLGNNPILSLEPLAKLKKLKILNITGNGSSLDLSPLLQLENLQEIHVPLVSGERNSIEALKKRCQVVEY